MASQGNSAIPAESASGEAALSDAVRAPLHGSLLGKSALIDEVRELVGRLAGSKLSVLVTGESGTGKDIVARLLHQLSARRDKPFVKVNCPALPETILESELFGYERGAFTGARTSKPGRFEIANHGTLFLDEIAETSFAVQGKLLQVLDGEPFLRIGGVTPLDVDVRIIAATNVNLEEAVREGRMREDMYFRLSEVEVHMPALRDRREDIPLLAEHFNYNFCKKLNRTYQGLAPEILAEMQRQEWPGNVRQLGARVKRYVATENVDALLHDEVEDGPSSARPDAAPSADSKPAAEAPRMEIPQRKILTLKEATRRAVEVTERTLIDEALRATRWNRRKAAKLLDISYSSLLRRIDAYNMGKNERE